MTIPLSQIAPLRGPNRLSPARYPPGSLRPQRSGGGLIDRILGRLFPSDQYEGLLSPMDLRATQRQGLLQLGAHLLQAGGPSLMPHNLGQDLGKAYGATNYQDIVKQAVEGRLLAGQVQRQQDRDAAIQRAGEKYPVQANETPDQTYMRLSKLVSELAGVPGTEEMVGKLSNVLAQLRPQQPDQMETVRIDRGDRIELVHRQTGQVIATFTKGVSPSVKFERITDTQRAAAGLGANMAQAHLAMRQIEQTHPEALNEVATMVRSGRVAGSLPLVGPTFDEAIRAGKAPALSQPARQLLNQVNSWLAAATPERGGKQLTLAEMKLFLEEYLYDIGDDPKTTAMKIANRVKRLQEARTKAGGAWDRTLAQFGLSNENLFGNGGTPKPTPAQPDASEPDPLFVPRPR